MTSAPLRIGTRGSKLALWQAHAVRDALCAAHDMPTHAFDIVAIKTSGDRIQDRALAEAGGKGLFSKEIEESLLAGAIDFAVHSAKDMETFLAAGLVIGAVLEREDVRDALIAPGVTDFMELPRDAVIGTASLRREALVRRARPDLGVALLRGNVPTRLRRVEEGSYAATLLALAGLKRLGLERHAVAVLPIAAFPPACGQGAVAVECRRSDDRIRGLLAAIDHQPTAVAIRCERAFLAALQGSCRTPIAGYAALDGGTLQFTGTLLAPDGSEWYQEAGSGPPADAEAIGGVAGEGILSRAPAGFLRQLGLR